MSNLSDKVIEIAKNEIGYLEKRTNANLDSKTANSGYNNYTKYWRDVVPSLQGSYWCACFVTWCFQQAYGKEACEKLLHHYPYVLCQRAYELFKEKGQCYSEPQIGDIVVFWNGSRMHHTGIVINVYGNTFVTVEGNTSGSSSVVANGGGVAMKYYSIPTAKASGHKFLRPAYDKKPKTKDCSSTVKKWQKYMNKKYESLLSAYCGELLVVDGIFGKKSKRAAMLVWKKLSNEKYKSGLLLDSTDFGEKCKEVAKKCIVKNGLENQYVVVLKGLLAGQGLFTATTINGKCKKNTVNAIKNYQILNGLSSDGECGKNTWTKLFS